MKRRVLFVVSRPLQVNTSSSIRNKATILGLVENGYQVDLITSFPDKFHMAYDSSMDLGDSVSCKYVNLGGIQSLAKVGRRLSFLRPIYTKITHIFEKQSLYDNLIGIVNHTSEVNLKESEYDFIISSSDPKSSHLFVEKLLKEQGPFFKGKWIQVWGDPFYDDITLPHTVDKQKVYEEELRLISRADKVVYVSQLTLKKQQQRYHLYASKMEYLPIPYNKEIIAENKDLSKQEIITVTYCGDYNSKVRNIVPFYKAVKEMEKLRVIIYGNSDLLLNECSNMIIKPRQSMADVEKVEFESDILVHLSNLRGGQIPGKLYQYSGTNKPILFILDGESDLLRFQFERYNRYVFSNNDKDSIKFAISQICKRANEYKPVSDFSKISIAKKIVSFEP